MTNRDSRDNYYNVFLDGNDIYVLGTKIIKKFNGVPYEGIVQYYDEINKWYKIRYEEDGDEEEMDHNEVTEHLKFKKQNRKRRQRARARTRKNKNSGGQRNLQGELIEEKDSDVFGDEYPEQIAENCSIITYQNVGQQPMELHDKKAQETAKAFKVSKASIALYAEVSLNESKIPVNEKFNDRMQQHNQRSFSIVGSNRHIANESPWNVTGGTALTMDSSFASHKTTQGIGKDPEGLGRWVWTRLRGKDQMHTRFVSAYRPCNNPGIATTWAQHLNYFRENRIPSEDPREKFDEDLCEEIRRWKLLGDIIIIGIDMNEDAYKGKLSQKFKDLGLKPLIKSTHPNESPPATHESNQKRTTIEEIWGTDSVCVNRAGFMPFESSAPSAPSDGHRMLWIEVDNNSILGKEAPHSSKSFSAIKFNSKDPRCRKSYEKRVRKGYNKDNIFKAHRNLQKGIRRYEKGTLKNTANFIKKFPGKYNKFQSKTRDIKMKAGAKTRKIKAGKRPWSPKYKEIVLPLEFWRRVKKWKSGRNTSRKIMKRIATKINFDWNLAKRCSFECAEKKWKLARKKYFSTKHLHDGWRKEHQFTMIDALAKEEHLPRETIKKRMRREDGQRDMGRKSRRITGKFTASSVFRAITINEEGETIELNSQSEMVPIIAESNRRRQMQCAGTPFMCQPLLQIFGYLANEEPAHQVKNGTFEIPEGIDPVVSDLIKSLKMPEKIRERGEISLCVTPKENAAGWKKMKDKTSSAHGTPTFNHYRTISQIDDLNRIDTFLANAPLILGFVPDGWKHVTDLQIPKRIDSPLVDRMRCIQLFDSEYNMINKILTRRVMKNAEEAEALEPDQFGSRKGHKAICALLNKIIINDIFRQRRASGAFAINDAKGCFDRINHTFAILVLMCFGMNWTQASVLMETLQKCEHSIKTGYGVSTPAYGIEEEEPLNGLGQGNGAGTCLWAIISSQMIKVMKERGYGFNFRTALTATLISIAAVAYVDDSDNPMMADSVETTGEQIRERFQEELDCWSKLLVATGGELDPEKSNCYIIDFAWDGDKWNYRTIEEMPGDFTLLDKEGTRHPLERLEVSHATETLGVFISMDGNSEAQKKALTEKAKRFAERLRTSNCDANTATYTYNTCFIKSMEYCMPVTNFTKEEWTTIISPAKTIALQKSRMSSSIPTASLYGTLQYNGFFFEDPYKKQGIEKIMTFIQEISKESQTGTVIKSGIENFIRELGFNSEISMIPWERVKEYVTNCWHCYLLEFLYEINKKRNQQSLYIEIKENFFKLEPLRVKDTFIMEEFVKSKKIKTKDLLILNVMRQSIKAITMSDICDGECNRISTRAWNLQDSNGLREDLDWPRKPPNFTNNQVRLWRESLFAVYGRNYEAESSRLINYEYIVGNWISEDARNRWKCFHSVSEKCLYTKEGNQWRVWRTPDRVRRSRYYRTNEILDEPHATADKAATVQKTIIPNTLRLESFLTWHHQDPIIDPFHYDPYKGPFTEIEYAFDESVSSKRILIDEYRLPSDKCTAIANAIREGKACIISDGSYFPDKESGSSAFILTAGKTKKNRLTGMNWVVGTKEDQNPYRSELAGIDGALSMVAIVIQFYNIEQGGIEIALDGESALNRAKDSKDYLNISQSCYDILQDIRNRLRLLPKEINIKWRHVEGHQKEKGRTNLDFWAVMNDKCDKIAKSYLRKCIKNKRKHKPVQLWHEQMAIFIDGEKQTNVNKKDIYSRLIKDEIFDYWTTHHNFRINDCESIDWKSFHAAIKRCPVGIQRFSAKFTTGFIGNRHKLHQWNGSSSPKCPNCDSPIEKSSHVLRCNNPKTKDRFKKNLLSIKKQLSESKTNRQLQNSILKILKNWRDGLPIRNETFTKSFGIRKAIKDQEKIGWNNFMLGRWSKRWKKVQQRYLKKTKSKRSASRWTSSIIYKFIYTVWDTWDFRNQLLHGKGGVIQRAKKKELDFLIQQEFTKGFDGFLKKDRHLRRKYSLSKLIESPLNKKQDWLRSVRAARTVINTEERAPRDNQQDSQPTILNFVDNDADS